MDERKIKAQLRREMGKTGWALLIYYLLMNTLVSLAGVLQFVVSAVINGVENVLFDNTLFDALLENGWGYLAAITVGGVLMLLWKKKQFCFHTIWESQKDMTAGSFFMLLAIFLGGQIVFSLTSQGLEYVFNLFGLSVTESIEFASGTSNSFSMFLYIGLLAPIAEEILFRGLFLRMLLPYGKRFAILSTAFLFGIFHENIVQSPFAFVMGLVLGYVAVEYSMGWAMVLHMINNMLVADSLTRLSNLLPPWAGELIFAVLLLGSAIAAIIILLCKRKEIAAYRRENPMHPWCVSSFFSSEGVIVLTVLMTLNMLLTVTALAAG